MVACVEGGQIGKGIAGAMVEGEAARRVAEGADKKEVGVESQFAES